MNIDMNTSASEIQPLLAVDELGKRFDSGSALLKRQKSVYAVNEVSFSINEGETYGLVGESGCGKSTTGRLVQGLLKPTAGSVNFKGRDIAALGKRGLREYATQVQTVFQDPYASLNPRFRINTSLEEVLKIHGVGNSRSRKILIEDAIAEVGFGIEVVDRFPHEFSGGQRQRLGIARALLVEPELLICDEPVSALDVSVQSQVLNMLKRLQKEKNIALLFISHDLSVVKYIAQRVGVMYLGRLIEEAPTERLYSRPMHPYTKALLQSVPINHPAKRRPRTTLKGEVPSQTEKIEGCVFRNRCPLAAEVCETTIPKLRDIKRGHRVACHLV